LLVVSCKTTKQANQTTAKEALVTPDEALITLDKGGCYGSCPSYELIIYNNRYVSYDGRKDVDKKGTHAKMLSKDSYKAIVKAFDQAGFFDFENEYPSNIPDLPTIKMSYAKNGLTKTVVGKRERPEPIHKLQFLLEEIAQSEGWTKVADTKKRMTLDKSRIVVDIAQASHLPKWFSKLKELYGVQIVQKLSDNSDSWLIGIEPRLHNPEEVLHYLLSDPGVKSARFQEVEAK